MEEKRRNRRQKNKNVVVFGPSSSSSSSKSKSQSSTSQSDISYEVFYNQNQIRQAVQEQKKDVFNDIILQKREHLNSFLSLHDLKDKDLIDISQFAPVEPQQAGQNNSKNKKRKKLIKLNSDSDLTQQENELDGLTHRDHQVKMSEASSTTNRRLEQFGQQL